MADFDELRAFAEDDVEDEEELDDDFFSSTAVIDDGGGSGFLGMTPVERMLVAVFFFMDVAILGVAFLLATGRI